MSPSEPTPVRSTIREAIAEAGRQIESILDSAEEAAAEIRVKAEEDAERHLAERREEVEKVVAVQAQVERLEQFS